MNLIEYLKEMLSKKAKVHSLSEFNIISDQIMKVISEKKMTASYIDQIIEPFLKLSISKYD